MLKIKDVERHPHGLSAWLLLLSCTNVHKFLCFRRSHVLTVAGQRHVR